MLLTYEWKFGVERWKNIILKSLEIREYIIMQNINIFFPKKYQNLIKKKFRLFQEHKRPADLM